MPVLPWSAPRTAWVSLAVPLLREQSCTGTGDQDQRDLAFGTFPPLATAFDDFKVAGGEPFAH